MATTTKQVKDFGPILKLMAEATACSWCGERMHHVVTYETFYERKIKHVKDMTDLDWSSLSYPKMYCSRCSDDMGFTATSMWHWNSKSIDEMIRALHDMKKKPWCKRVLISRGKFSREFWNAWKQTKSYRAGSNFPHAENSKRTDEDILKDEMMNVYEKFHLLFPKIGVWKSKQTGEWYIYFNDGR
jgi:hypothetical protein